MRACVCLCVCVCVLVCVRCGVVRCVGVRCGAVPCRKDICAWGTKMSSAFHEEEVEKMRKEWTELGPEYSNFDQFRAVYRRCVSRTCEKDLTEINKFWLQNENLSKESLDRELKKVRVSEQQKEHCKLPVWIKWQKFKMVEKLQGNKEYVRKAASNDVVVQLEKATKELERMKASAEGVADYLSKH